MLQTNSMVHCIDNTGVVIVKIFQLVGTRHRRKVNMGDLVWVSVKARNLKAKNMQDKRQLRRFRRGAIHRAIVVQTKIKYQKRNDNTYLRFNKNAVILVDKIKTPLGSKIKEAIPREIIRLYPKVGSIAEYVV